MYSNRGWSYSRSRLSGTSARRRRQLPLRYAIGPLPLAVLLVGGLGWEHFAFPGFSVQGVVLDSVSGQPIEAARVWSSRATSATAADGWFDLGGVKPLEVVGVDAPE